MLVGVGQSLRWFASGYSLPPGETALVLSDKEMVVVRAWVEVVLPATREAPGGVELGIHQRIDEELWAQPDEMRSDIKAAIQLIEHAPPWFGVLGRFSSLKPERRLEVAEKMLVSGPDLMVQAAVALKQLSQLHYGAHPATWKSMGYDGPWIGEAKPPVSHLRYMQLLDEKQARLAQKKRRA